MTVVRRSPFYALCLLIGALLFGVAGLFHPVLKGDGASQLVLIAGMESWRAIHWSLLFAIPLMLTGLAGFSLRHQETPGAGSARAGVIVAALGFAALMLNILFMVGAAWQLARTYVSAVGGLAATHAVFLYDMVHPMGLAAERLATFTLGFAFYLFGWAVWNGRLLPRVLAWWSFAAGAIGMGIPLFVLETSVWLFYVQGVMIAWFAVTGAVMLVRR